MKKCYDGAGAPEAKRAKYDLALTVNNNRQNYALLEALRNRGTSASSGGGNDPARFRSLSLPPASSMQLTSASYNQAMAPQLLGVARAGQIAPQHQQNPQQQLQQHVHGQQHQHHYLMNQANLLPSNQQQTTQQSQPPFGQHRSNLLNPSQDELIRLLLLEQHLKSLNQGNPSYSTEGMNQLQETASALAAANPDMSTNRFSAPQMVSNGSAIALNSALNEGNTNVSQLISQLNVRQQHRGSSFDGVSPFQAQLHRQLNPMNALPSSYSGTSNVTGAAFNSNNHTRSNTVFSNPLLPSVAQQTCSQTFTTPPADERIQSHLLNPVDIGGAPDPTDDAKPAATPKGIVGVSHEGDRLIALAMNSEHWVMSEYQCLLRQQLVFVESTVSAKNNNGKTQGRNKPIVYGQVGILCRHCAGLPSEERPRGGIYYPAKLHRIYQAAQNMAHNHFSSSCVSIPDGTRKKLQQLKDQKAVTVGAGKEYWYSAAVTVGIREGENGLFFCKPAT